MVLIHLWFQLWGQGQGIGQDRCLCNGRVYSSYGVRLGFILFNILLGSFELVVSLGFGT